MAAVWYPPMLVIDPTNGLPLLEAREQVGTIVSGGTTTPVALLDSLGLSLANPVSVSSYGFLPGFWTPDETPVEWLSLDEEWRIPLWSPTGLHAAAVAAAASAASSAAGVSTQVSVAETHATQAVSAADAAAQSVTLAQAAVTAAQAVALGGVPLPLDGVAAALLRDIGTALGETFSTVMHHIWYDTVADAWPPRPQWPADGWVRFNSFVGDTAVGPTDAGSKEYWDEHEVIP